MVDLAANYLTSFSTRPLRLAVYLGLLMSLLSAATAAVYLVKTLLFGTPVAGFPTLILAISLLGGMQLFVLGIVGEYLGKMFIEVQARQLYVVEGTINLDRDTVLSR
jgi:hypothetical protein